MIYRVDGNSQLAQALSWAIFFFIEKFVRSHQTEHLNHCQNTNTNKIININPGKQYKVDVIPTDLIRKQPRITSTITYQMLSHIRGLKDENQKVTYEQG